MTENIVELLCKAIENDADIRIRYQGGSQPGSVRLIRPKSVTGDILWATCLETNNNKSFRIDKIEVLDSDGEYSRSEKYLQGTHIKEPQNLIEALSGKIDMANTENVFLVVEENFAGLFKKFKNGKQTKHPFIQIRYQPETIDYTSIDENGIFREVVKPSIKPWHVDSNLAKNSAAFKNLKAATEKFIYYINEWSEKNKN